MKAELEDILRIIGGDVGDGERPALLTFLGGC